MPLPIDPDFPNLRDATLHIWYSNAHIAGENLSGSGTTWTFAHTPVSYRNLKLTGYYSGSGSMIVNFTIEPMSGALVTASQYTSVSGTYNYWPQSGTAVVDGVKPTVDAPQYRRDMDGQYHWTVPNMYPREFKFNMFVRRELYIAKAFVNLSVVNAWHYMVIDEPSFVAYEGPIMADQFLSVKKGDDIFMEVTIYVQKFGLWNPVSGTIDWKAWKNFD